MKRFMVVMLLFVLGFFPRQAEAGNAGFQLPLASSAYRYPQVSQQGNNDMTLHLVSTSSQGCNAVVIFANDSLSQQKWQLMLAGYLSHATIFFYIDNIVNGVCHASDVWLG